MFMVRRHALLLILDPLRAIVLRDRLLLLVPDGADEILNHLESRLRGGLQDLEDDVFGHAIPPPSPSSPDDGMAQQQQQQGELDDFILHPKGPKGRSIIIRPTSSPSSSLISTPKNTSQQKDTLTTQVATIMVDTVQSAQPSQKEYTPTLHTIPHTNYYSKDHPGHVYKKSSSSLPPIHDEWQDIDQRTFTQLPFELLAVDVVLESVVRLLSIETKQLCTSVEATMKHILSVMEGGKVQAKITSSSSSSSTAPPTIDYAHNSKKNIYNYERLHILKDKVKETQSRIKGLERALTLVLDDDADLALMNLSRLMTHPERFIFPLSPAILNQEADNPELILEVYLEQAFNASNTLELLLGKINTTEGLVDVKLDTIRNRLLFVNTFFSLIMLFLGAGGVVSSLLGMNLLNYMEDNPTAFTKVVCGTIVGGLVLFCLACLIFWKHSTWLLHT
jgi:magnesium transporter